MCKERAHNVVEHEVVVWKNLEPYSKLRCNCWSNVGGDVGWWQNGCKWKLDGTNTSNVKIILKRVESGGRETLPLQTFKGEVDGGRGSWSNPQSAPKMKKKNVMIPTENCCPSSPTLSGKKVALIFFKVTCLHDPYWEPFTFKVQNFNYVFTSTLWRFCFEMKSHSSAYLLSGSEQIF